MRFNQTVLHLKERYLDSTPPELVRRAAEGFLGGVPESLTEVPRQWTPGGGSQNFIARAQGRRCFIKAKHKSLLVESALESEPDFPHVSALENERAFLGALASEPHVPRVLGFAEYGGYQFLATEVLQPFSVLTDLGPARIVAVFEQLADFARVLYQQGIVHTDIHEKNICFRGVTPVLIDFEEARRFPQTVPFEISLDVAGVCGADSVGDFPALERDSIPGPTCLNRLRKVFKSLLRRKLPDYLAQCNFDCTSAYNLDEQQQPDERIYQSVTLPDLTIAGQRPVQDPRLAQVGHVLDYVQSVLGRALQVVDLGSNMGMVSFFCADRAQTRSVLGLEADPRYVEAANVLAFYNDSDRKVAFREYMTGASPYAWPTDVLLMLSVYHHVADKDAFLRELAARNITCILGEFATQERYYPQRGSVRAEIEHIRTALGFRHAEYVAVSADYQRPMVAFHNGRSRSIRERAAAVAAHSPTAVPAGVSGGDAAGFCPGAQAGRALAWLRKHSPEGGVSVSNRQAAAYPEVTGYCIPTLLQWGEAGLAAQYARWLMSIQNADGSFSGPGISSPFAFDTGQIIRGLAAIAPSMPEAVPALERACRWIVRTASPEGRLALPENRGAWSLGARGHVNEAIHLYVLPGLHAAAEVLNAPGYADFARRSLDYYIQHCNLTNFLAPNMLLHFYCYIQEALFDLGAEDICRQGMRELAERQAENGMVPAYARAAWICTPGLIQAALVWLKLGDMRHALPALRLAQSLQTESGGFPGSVGEGADYFPGEELSWAVKFWLDALAVHAAGAQAGGAARSGENEASAVELVSEQDIPLISLAGAAMARLEDAARQARAARGVSPAELENMAQLVPVLLDWGRREQALALAGVLAKNMDRILPEQDCPRMFLPGRLLRAFRQPEVLAVHGEAALKALCVQVLRRQRLGADNAPGLFCCFAELREAGQTLQESAWVDCARHWAAQQGSLPDQRATPELVQEAVAVGLLLAPENGLALLRRMAESMGPSPQGPELRQQYALLSLWLAWGAWSLGDDALGQKAYCQGLSALAHSGRKAWPRDVFSGEGASACAFLSAVSAMQRCRFARYFPQFLDDIASEDGRLRFVQSNLPDRAEARLLDMGTGKGRYLRRLYRGGHGSRWTGQDVHLAFARFMPKGVATGVGTVLRSGWADGHFDAVLLCEVLEHCIDLPAAVAEMRRILAPGGTLIIVDKNVARLATWPGGIPPWEQWFDCEALAGLLRRNGFAVRALDPDLGYENRRDGLFFGLAAVKEAVA